MWMDCNRLLSSISCTVQSLLLHASWLLGSMCVCVVWAHLSACCDRSITYALQTVTRLNANKAKNIIEFKHLVDDGEYAFISSTHCVSVWRSVTLISQCISILETKKCREMRAWQRRAPTHKWTPSIWLKVENDFGPFGRCQSSNWVDQDMRIGIYLTLSPLIMTRKWRSQRKWLINGMNTKCKLASDVNGERLVLYIHVTWSSTVIMFMKRHDSAS